MFCFDFEALRLVGCVLIFRELGSHSKSEFDFFFHFCFDTRCWFFAHTSYSNSRVFFWSCYSFVILFFFLYGIHCVLVIGFHFVFRREVVLVLVCSIFVSDSVLYLFTKFVVLCFVLCSECHGGTKSFIFVDRGFYSVGGNPQSCWKWRHGWR